MCSQYNDFFVSLLNPIPTGQMDGNISFDKQGNPVSVNNAFVEVCGCDGGPPCNADSIFPSDHKLQERLGRRQVAGASQRGDGLAVIALAQRRALNFSSARARQFAHKFDRPRIFVGRDRVFHEFLQRPLKPGVAIDRLV